ncbi:hypothetical protein EJB05_41636, partial [Eragrostis curvula]
MEWGDYLIVEFAKKAAAALPANAVAQGAVPPANRRYKGATRRSDGKWSAYLDSRGRRMWLGTHDAPEEAACAHDAAARTFTPAAPTNFPEPAGEEDKRRVVVLAHVARVKSERAKRMGEAARRKMDAAKAAMAV